MGCGACSCRPDSRRTLRPACPALLISTADQTLDRQHFHFRQSSCAIELTCFLTRIFFAIVASRAFCSRKDDTPHHIQMSPISDGTRREDIGQIMFAGLRTESGLASSAGDMLTSARPDNAPSNTADRSAKFLLSARLNERSLSFLLYLRHVTRCWWNGGLWCRGRRTCRRYGHRLPAEERPR